MAAQDQQFLAQVDVERLGGLVTEDRGERGAQPVENRVDRVGHSRNSRGNRAFVLHKHDRFAAGMGVSLLGGERPAPDRPFRLAPGLLLRPR